MEIPFGPQRPSSSPGTLSDVTLVFAFVTFMTMVVIAWLGTF